MILNNYDEVDYRNYYTGSRIKKLKLKWIHNHTHTHTSTHTHTHTHIYIYINTLTYKCKPSQNSNSTLYFTNLYRKANNFKKKRH